MTSYQGLQLALPHLGGLEITTFTQAVTATNANPDFDSWSGDNPVNWTVVGEAPPDYTVVEAAPDGSAGTGAALFYKNGGSSLRVEQTLISGAWYEFEIIRSYRDNLDSFLEVGSLQFYQDAHAQRIRRADTPAARFYVYNGPGHIALDRLKLNTLSLNAEHLAAVDGLFEFHFTLPGSPLSGHCARLWYRAAGDQNYWEARVERSYAGTAWDFRLDSVSGAVATNRIAAAGVGSPNAIRVIVSGNEHKAYTSADGGATWTQRGSAVNNTTHNTQAGIRAVYSDDTTPIRLKAN